MSNTSVPFIASSGPLQALKKRQIGLQKRGLIVSIVANIMAIAAEIQPIDGPLIPQHRPAVLPTRPIGSAVVPVPREQLRQKGPNPAVPRHLRDVRPEQRPAAAAAAMSRSTSCCCWEEGEEGPRAEVGDVDGEPLDRGGFDGGDWVVEDDRDVGGGGGGGRWWIWGFRVHG
ncbi:hypothetical protein Sjap_012847 [Stephania japonica]|uniref:Uncharacterized protein n=1 Tax=Stephania japonica TaxID=461633 RepID=A0AAP0IXM7_9MAGN